MSQPFPLYSKTARSGDAGVNAVSQIVNDVFGWIFRRNHTEYNFGIDVVTENGGVTGQTLAIQIKSGASYFSTETPSSFTYYGETKHLNYYLNSAVPIILLIHNPECKASYWVRFEGAKTERTSTGWKISVPKKNKLSLGTKSDFLEIVGPAVDHSDALQAHWSFNETLATFESIYYAIDRSDIESLDPLPLSTFFQRIVSNEALSRKFQGRIELSVAGYHNDPRELWEIPRVRKWFKIADQLIEHWFFFCNTQSSSYGLRTYFFCLCRAKRTNGKPKVHGKVDITVDLKRILDVLVKNRPRLNAMTDSLGMSIEENKRITFAVMDLLNIKHDT